MQDAELEGKAVLWLITLFCHLQASGSYMLLNGVQRAAGEPESPKSLFVATAALCHAAALAGAGSTITGLGIVPLRAAEAGERRAPSTAVPGEGKNNQNGLPHTRRKASGHQVLLSCFF